MFHGKCAYCESNVLHVGYPRVEHFYPKEKYLKKTFEWDNLLLSCEVCNGPEYKGSKFPFIKGKLPAFRNPCEDDPSEHFDFHFDTKTRIASVIARTERGRITRKELGLNRSKLRKYRSMKLKTLYALSLNIDSDPVAKALFEEAAGGAEEYSAFVRALNNPLKS